MKNHKNLPTRFKSIFLKDGIFLLVVIVVTAIINNFLLKLPGLSFYGDGQRVNGYQAYVMKYSLSSFGQFGLWDQFLSSGTSWISHPGGALFSPIAWIATFITSDVSKGSFLIFYLNTFLASLAYYFLCRVLGLHKITSFFVAILAVSNEYIFTFVANGWFEEFFGFAIIPSTVGLLWLALTRKSYKYAIIGGLIMSFNFFSNSYYVFHYNVMSLLWIGLLFIISDIWKILKQKKKIWKNFIHPLFINGVFWSVFIGISAIKVIPLLEFRSISARLYLPLSVVDSSNGVMTFQFFQSLFRDFIIPAGHTNSFTHWVNDLALFFLLLSAIYFLFKKTFKHGVFLALFAIGVWGYFAYRMPIDLYVFVYNFLPGFNSNNYPYRFMIIIYFAFLVCVGLGLDLLINQKNKFFYFLGIFLGGVMAVGASWYTTVSYNTLKYPQMYDVKKDIKGATFTIEKSENYSAPKIQGEISSDILADLSRIVSAYKPEGRTYSTLAKNSGLTQTIVLEQEIPSLHHLYSPIVPTYEYAIISAGTTQDNLMITEKRYKIFSILNARFHVQGKENFEYNGCNNLDLPKKNIESSTIEEKRPMDGVCDFLEARLSRVITTNEGGIYYDSDVLPKITLIPHPMLLITDNSFNDYSGFIAKQIVFHKDFDVKSMSVVSGGSIYVDDYSLETLNKFPVVILVEPKIKNKSKTDMLLNQYEKGGGKVVTITGKKIHYESLHERSASIHTAKPAWVYTDKESEELSGVLQTLKTDNTGSIEIKKFTPEDIVFNVKTVKDNEVLQFSDSFFPGWKASIDDKKTSVYMADGLVKAVIVPQQGTHLVRFYYAPDSLKKGAIISGVTVLVIGILFILKFLGKINL